MNFAANQSCSAILPAWKRAGDCLAPGQLGVEAHLPQLFLDLDGVFTAFYQKAFALLGRAYQSVPRAEAWAVLERQEHLFLHLEMLPDAQQLWDGVAHYENKQILSALPWLTQSLVTAPADKVEWVRRRLDRFVQVNLVESGRAKARFARPGDLLVDDLPENIEAWEAAGGVGILHTSAEATLRKLAELLPSEFGV